ncbi:MAG TPA: metallophosphoesterase [bacterium]|nr:metallophosphoesterase [bacterium]
MRILACADLHGYAERIARVRSLVDKHAPAVLLLPGDLTHAGRGEEALDLLGALTIPVLAVPGNMDDAHAVSEIDRRGSLAGSGVVEIAGVTFGGPRVASRCDVLVTHEPPAGTLDLARAGRHIGTRTVLDLLTRLRPRVLACGHVHEAGGIQRLGETLIVNCTMGDGKTGGALIEVEPDGVTARLLQ